MTSRINDLRIHQAQQHGIIVGLPRALAEEVAALSDFLMDCHVWEDVTLIFEDTIVTHGEDKWRVPVADGWAIVFTWAVPFGPIDLELWHVDDS